MSYTFELSFTGLCVFTFKGYKRRPEQVNALLVDTRGHHNHHQDKDEHFATGSNPNLHLPFLSYDPRTLDSVEHNNPLPPLHRLVPTPYGSQMALQSLVDETLEIYSTATPPPLEARWRDTNDWPDLPYVPPEPTSETEEWLDWVMALQRMNPDILDPATEAPFAGLKNVFVARVRITQGTLLARNFLHLDNGNYQVWDFKVPGETEVSSSHAMAEQVVLRIPDIPNNESVKIIGNRTKIFLKPRLKTDGSLLEPGPLRASVTNLPEIEDTEAAFLTYLKHHKHFYDAVYPSLPKVKLPHKRGGVITSGSAYCPPTTHTKSE